MLRVSVCASISPPVCIYYFDRDDTDVSGLNEARSSLAFTVGNRRGECFREIAFIPLNWN